MFRMTKNFRREIGLAKELPVKPTERRLNSPPPQKNGVCRRQCKANAREQHGTQKKRLSSMQFGH